MLLNLNILKHVNYSRKTPQQALRKIHKNSAAEKVALEASFSRGKSLKIKYLAIKQETKTAKIIF